MVLSSYTDDPCPVCQHRASAGYEVRGGMTMTDMDRPLRVALVTFDFGEVCVRIANALSQDADVTLVLPCRELELAEVPADRAVQVIPYTKPRLRQPLRQLRMCATVLDAIRTAAPDVVHV